MAKILYIEDNEMNRDMLSRRLQRRDHEVLIAVDGQEGLEKIMDGWEATTKAKADEELQSIPIIALTAHALESDRQKALDCGADDFDTKPIDFKRLLQKIEDLL